MVHSFCNQEILPQGTGVIPVFERSHIPYDGVPDAKVPIRDFPAQFQLITHIPGERAEPEDYIRLFQNVQILFNGLGRQAKQ